MANGTGAVVATGLSTPKGTAQGTAARPPVVSTTASAGTAKPSSAPIRLCSSITKAMVAPYLGGVPDRQRPLPTAQPNGIVLVDGCNYGLGTRAQVTYSLLDVGALGANASAGDVAAFKQSLDSVEGVVPFDVGFGDVSYGATSKAATSSLAQIEVAKSKWLLRVDVVRDSAAAARDAALAIAEKLAPLLT